MKLQPQPEEHGAVAEASLEPASSEDLMPSEGPCSGHC